MDSRLQTQIDAYQQNLGDTKTALSTVYSMYYYTYGEQDALLSSSVAMSIGYDSVAEQIRAIPSTSCSFDLEFVDIGYSSSSREDALDLYVSSSEVRLDLSKELYDNWDPSRTTPPWPGSPYEPNFGSSIYGNIKYFPKVDTSNFISFKGMFREGKNLYVIPTLNTSKVVSFHKAFEKCRNLKYAPYLDTSQATNVERMFYNLTSPALTSLPKYDFSKVIYISHFFQGLVNSLKSVGGFSGLKIDWNDDEGLGQARYLTHESLINIFTELPDVTALGGKTLKISSDSMGLLSAGDLAIAQNKGWTITT